MHMYLRGESLEIWAQQYPFCAHAHQLFVFEGKGLQGFTVATAQFLTDPKHGAMQG